MKCPRRIAAVLLAVVFALVMLVSSAFIIHEAGHDCTGEDCPICQMIAANSQLLRLVGAVVLVLVYLLGIPGTKHIWHDARGFSVPVSGTLVSWKIRLNN